MTATAIAALDHVNVRSHDVARLAEWYGRVLGLRPGPRPDFDFPGLWLYAGDTAVIHLIGVPAPPAADPRTLRLEHFALGATGLGAFLDRLGALGIPFRMGRLPPGAADAVQVNLHDPDGNHLHVDFPGAEADALRIAPRPG